MYTYTVSICLFPASGQRMFIRPLVIFQINSE